MKNHPGHPAHHAPTRLRHRLLDPHRFARQGEWRSCKEKIKWSLGELNVRILMFREPKLEIVRAESKGWLTKMTKQTAWDPVDERQHSTILALKMGGPQLKTFRIGPIAAGRFKTLAPQRSSTEISKRRVSVEGETAQEKKENFRRMTDCMDDLIRVLQRHHHQRPFLGSPRHPPSGTLEW